MGNLMQHEIRTKLSAQAAFFKAERPHQAILGPGPTLSADLEEIEKTIRGVWARNGWKLTKGTMPQTRQIAEKQGELVLSVLYDFLFRFTSGTVHFNPQALLRSGWGDPRRGFTFRAANFDGYYLEVARVYSVYLLSLHFERFRIFLKPGSRETTALAELRRELRTRGRWPEIVTYEEMNLSPPKFSLHGLLAGFIDASDDRPLLQKRALKHKRPT